MTVTAMPGGETTPKRSNRTRLIIIGILALAVLAVVAYIFLRPSGGDATEDGATVSKEDKGSVITTEAIQVNLADGHYLRIAIGLQLTKEGSKGEETPSTAEAEDAVIHIFTNQPLEDVTLPADIDKYKAQLLADIQERYGSDIVMDVYLTQFVTQ